MLIDFFYTVKQAGVPVSIKEFLTLLEALASRSFHLRWMSSTISRA
jgi:uncharacterized protein with von Willebrand factor type A (vWA) domain